MQELKRYKIETERADLFDVNMMIVMSLSIKGEATRQQLEEAFNKAVLSHEVLNTHVVIDENGNAYYEESNCNNNTIEYSDKTANEVIYEQERKRFQIENGEYLRLFINDIEKGYFQMHFLMHHLGGDGKSLCYFIESFFRCLNGETLDKSTIKLLNLENLPANSKLPLWARRYIRKFNQAWFIENKISKSLHRNQNKFGGISKEVFDFKDMDEAYSYFWKTHQTEVIFEKIDATKLKDITDKCHDKKIGFTSYYIANEIKSSNKKMKIGLAVDGRMDGNKSMGNQATGISVDYRYDSDKDEYSNASKIHSLMQKKITNPSKKYFILHFMAGLNPRLVDSVNLEYAGIYSGKVTRTLASNLGYGERTIDLSVTNLTVLDIPTQYGEFMIEAMWFIPPVVSYGKNIVGLVTVNDELYVTKHHYK